MCVQYLNKSKPPLRMNPKNVGVVNRLYTRYKDGQEDDSIERFFSTEVESLYAPIAKRISDEKGEFVLTNEDFFVLVKFVVCQIVRTKAHLRCIEEQAGTALNTEVFIHNMARKMSRIVDRWIAKPPHASIYTPATRDSHFITGDNPVFSVTETRNYTGSDAPSDVLAIVKIDQILEDPNSEFTVPLSPFVCLTIRNDGAGLITPYAQPRPPAWVSTVNQRVYRQCVQFVEAMHERTLGFHVRRNTPALP